MLRHCLFAMMLMLGLCGSPLAAAGADENPGGAWGALAHDVLDIILRSVQHALEASEAQSSAASSFEEPLELEFNIDNESGDDVGPLSVTVAEPDYAAFAHWETADADISVDVSGTVRPADASGRAVAVTYQALIEWDLPGGVGEWTARGSTVAPIGQTVTLGKFATSRLRLTVAPAGDGAEAAEAESGAEDQP